MEFVVPESSIRGVDESFRTFKCIFIPADVNEEIVEMTVPQAPNRSLSAMLDFAKTHFSKSAMSKAGLAQLKSQIKEQHAETNDAMATKLAEMTLCEVVPLLSHSAKTMFLAVNLVVDDKAVAKQLDANRRASAICASCGLLNMQVRGDAFLCRQFDNEEGFYRLDFTMGDLNQQTTSKDPLLQTDYYFFFAASGEDDKSSTATSGGSSVMNSYVDPLWMELAKAIRLNDSGFTEKTAKQYKDRGNDLFRAGLFKQALIRYSQASSLIGASSSSSFSELRAQLCANKSACRLKIGDMQGALEEADASLREKPNWNKAWGRRAEALKALGRDEEAIEATKRAGLSS